MTMIKPPQADGLYDPRYEHDACGVAFVARLDDVPAPRRRRPARSRRSRTSSTAAPRAPTPAPATAPGILLQLPDAFFRARRRLRAARRPGATASACASCPRDEAAARELEAAARAQRRATRASASLGWRDVPVDAAHVGDTANALAPVHPPALRRRRRPSSPRDQDAFERKLYVIRRVVELAAGPDLVRRRASRSRTIVYKGMLTAPQLARLLPRPARRARREPRSRSSTRASRRTRSRAGSSRTRTAMIAHNGEINTLRGNVNWMRARESQLASELFGDDLAEGPAGRPPRRLGLGDVRQRARAARARRPLAAARDDDDDPGGLRRTATTCPTSCGLLRLPLVPDGAVGRPGGGRASPTAA